MFRKTLAAIVIAFLAAITGAQAQTTETLGENLHATLVQCISSYENGVVNSGDFKRSECVKVSMRALQGYVDAATACIKAPANSLGGVSDICKEAKILEIGTIKTFRQPAKQAGR